MDDLGDWLRRAAPGDEAALDRLEDDVWNRVKTIQSRKATDRTRLAAVGLALVIGVANGGLVAKFTDAPASEMAVFSAARLSPLARLEVG